MTYSFKLLDISSSYLYSSQCFDRTPEVNGAGPKHQKFRRHIIHKLMYTDGFGCPRCVAVLLAVIDIAYGLIKSINNLIQ